MTVAELKELLKKMNDYDDVRVGHKAKRVTGVKVQQDGSGYRYVEIEAVGE